MDPTFVADDNSDLSGFRSEVRPTKARIATPPWSPRLSPGRRRQPLMSSYSWSRACDTSIRHIGRNIVIGDG